MPMQSLYDAIRVAAQKVVNLSDQFEACLQPTMVNGKMKAKDLMDPNVRQEMHNLGSDIDSNPHSLMIQQCIFAIGVCSNVASLIEGLENRDKKNCSSKTNTLIEDFCTHLNTTVDNFLDNVKDDNYDIYLIHIATFSEKIAQLMNDYSPKIEKAPHIGQRILSAMNNISSLLHDFFNVSKNDNKAARVKTPQEIMREYKQKTAPEDPAPSGKVEAGFF